MAKFKAIFPFIDDMGTVEPMIITPSPMETKEEQALWHLNRMRDHDGLKHLSKVPAGTKFERIDFD